MNITKKINGSETEQETEILVPVRDAWQPDILTGYLPITKNMIEKIDNATGLPVVIIYQIDQAPPGTQLSFVLSRWNGDVSLCSFSYPEELLHRIDAFQSINDVANNSETRH